MTNWIPISAVSTRFSHLKNLFKTWLNWLESRVYLRFFGGHPFLAAGICSILFTYLFYSYCPPAFTVNDDSSMMLILNGWLTGSASFNLPFIHLALSKLLYSIVSLFPFLPVYGLFLSSLFAAALFMQLAAFFILRPPVWILSLLIALFLTLQGRIMLGFSFTTASLFLGFGSLILLLAAGKRRNSCTYCLVFGGLGLVVCYLTRTNSLWASLIFGVPILLAFLKENPTGRRKLAVTAAIIAASIVSLNLYQSVQLDRLPELKAYREFNKFRGKVHGNPLLKNKASSEKLARTVNWSKTDISMFRLHFFTDPDHFSTEKLKLLSANISPVEHENFEDTFKRLSTGVKQIYQTDRKYLLPAVSILIASLLFLSLRLIGLQLFVLCFYTATSAAVFFYVGRFPTRVNCAVLAFLPALSLWISCRHGSSSRPAGRWKTPLGILLSALIVYQFIMPVASFKRVILVHRRGHEHVVKRLNALYDYNPEGIYAAWFSGGLHDVSPFATKSDLPPAKLIPLGWHTNSPEHNLLLKRAGIKDLYLSIIKNPSVCILTKEQGLLDLYQSYLREHYNLSCSMVPVSDKGFLSRIYCSSTPPCENYTSSGGARKTAK